MENVGNLLAGALFLSGAVERFVEAFVKPIFEKFNLDKFWLTYIAWTFASVLVWFGNIDLVTPVIAIDPLVAKIVTAVIAGGGSTILSDIYQRAGIKE